MNNLEDISEDKLNTGQKHGLELMKKGKNIFLTGQGGVGKSYLLKVFVKWCIQNNKLYGITSTTGVSALLIGGTTVHSFTGILLGMEDKITLLERVRSRDKPFKRWLYTQVLIIDEISMMSSELLEKLDYIGKKIRKSTKPFGGIQLIFSGDFGQNPPVRSDYCFKSSVWDLLIDTTIYLTENMRQADPTFQTVLNEVRLGEPSSKTIKILQSRIGAQIKSPEGIIPTKLYSHRASVAKINHDSLMNIVTPENQLRCYNANDNVRRKDGNIVNAKYKEQYLSRIDKIFQAVKKLELCIGAQVMLIFNLDLKGGLVNGSRGAVIDFKNELPVVRFMNGIETPINKASWSMNLSGDVVVFRKQIPLILGYAITIHKAQGSTLDCAIIDLGTTIFTYGQSYTALSRVKSLEALSIVTFDSGKLVASPYVIEFYRKIEQNNIFDKVQENNIGKEETLTTYSRKKMCPICCDEEINSIYIPCGHIYSCLACSYNIDKCPVCRQDIIMRNKCYLTQNDIYS